MSEQPVWKYVGTVGDSNPVEYGGGVVMVDETGVYEPELEVYFPIWEEKFRDAETRKLKKDENGEPEYTVYVYRFDVPKYVEHEGMLTEERLLRPSRWGGMPIWYEPWWVKKLEEIADFSCITKEELVAELCADDPLQRAREFYFSICSYYGYEEFDSYPMIMPVSEAEKRCDNLMKKGVPVC